MIGPSARCWTGARGGGGGANGAPTRSDATNIGGGQLQAYWNSLPGEGDGSSAGEESGLLNSRNEATGISVEWSAALNANFCLTDAGGAYIEAMATAAASFITRVPNKNFIDPITNLDTIISDLLVLDNAAPIDLSKSSNSDSGDGPPERSLHKHRQRDS